MKRHSIQTPGSRPLMMGVLGVAFLGVVLDVGNWLPSFSLSSNSQEACQGAVQADVALSREQLAQLLAVPERDSRSRVSEIVGLPYCQLQSLQVRAGVAAERQVYPLAFDPTTRLVILYEGDEYAGYRFSFQSVGF